ncbi:MAG: CapA family protein [Alphaproteobacteria bacterium]|nr:CapA family protein [Alphaproteobacteria bacterium]
MLLTGFDRDAEISGTIMFGGDVNLGRYLNSLHGTGRSAAALEAVTGDYDLKIVNLESVVASTGELGVAKGEGGPYYFRGRPELLSILTDAEVDVVSLANNHTGDYGDPALLEMLALLDRSGLDFVGAGATRQAACAPKVVWAGETAIALIGADSTMRHFAARDTEPGTCYLPPKDPEAWRRALAPRIAAARERAHLVFVVVHWGGNYKTVPSKRTRTLARTIIDAGADAIMGSSAHILHGVEVIDGRPVIYDAGNLLFDFRWSREHISGFFELDISKRGIEAIRLVPTYVGFGVTTRAAPEWRDEVLDRFRQRSADLGTEVQVVNAHAVIDLDPPARHGEPRNLPERAAKRPRIAPQPLSDPPPQCTVSEVPDAFRTNPVSFGPVELIGLRIEPEAIAKRRPILIESYWRLAAEPVADNLLLYQRLKPEGTPTGRKSWRAHHEPCDWAWPTSRWVPGVIYRDQYMARPPKPLGDGAYRLSVGIRSPLTKDQQTTATEYTVMVQVER